MLQIIDIVNIVAVITGPVAAVVITLGYQTLKERRDAQRALFLTLLLYRNARHAVEAANALNTIVVIFDRHENVKKKWGDYYNSVCQPQSPQQQYHMYLDLLKEMAAVLRYKPLDVIGVDKFYTPQGLVDRATFENKVQTELLRVLENTARFETVPLTPPHNTTEITEIHLDNSISDSS